MSRLNQILNSYRPWQFAGAFFAAISVVFLHFSPALSSIFLAVSVVCTLGQVAQFWSMVKSPAWRIFTILSAAVLLQFVEGLPMAKESGFWEKALLKLPLVLIPFNLFWLVNSFSKTITLLILALPLTWLSGAGLLNYFDHQAFYNQMIAESKPVPLYSNIYHIEYSILQAMVGLLLLFYLWDLGKSRFQGFTNNLLAMCLIVIVVSLHIFSARTGILAFWFGLFSGILLARKTRFSMPWVLIGLFVSIVAMLAVPAVRNRMANTMADVTAVWNGKDLNNKSFGQRWVAWSASIDAIREKPWLGYGVQNVRMALDAQYAKNHHGLEPENRVNPHNQFLEMGIQSGVPGMLLLLIFGIFALFHGIRTRNGIFISVLMALGVSMMFESILERQAGVLFMFFFMSLAAIWYQETKDYRKFS